MREVPGSTSSPPLRRIASPLMLLAGDEPARQTFVPTVFVQSRLLASASFVVSGALAQPTTTKAAAKETAAVDNLKSVISVAPGQT
jgi:hypothetical protein